MKNFDCTILLSFEWSSRDTPIIKYGDFNHLDISIIEDKDIQGVKKDYFSKNKNEYFIEFCNAEFAGDIFDEWKILESPPKKVNCFIDLIKELILENNLKKVKLYICKFAQKGITENYVIFASLSEIKEKFFLMSNYNYDIWSDNLIININF